MSNCPYQVFPLPGGRFRHFCPIHKCSLATERPTLERECPPDPRQERPAKPYSLDLMRAGSVAAMAESIAALGTPTADAAARLAVCRDCDSLTPSGCDRCGGCSDRWPRWRERIVGGECKQFG